MQIKLRYHSSSRLTQIETAITDIALPENNLAYPLANSFSLSPPSPSGSLSLQLPPSHPFHSFIFIQQIPSVCLLGAGI